MTNTKFAACAQEWAAVNAESCELHFTNPKTHRQTPTAEAVWGIRFKRFESFHFALSLNDPVGKTNVSHFKTSFVAPETTK